MNSEKIVLLWEKREKQSETHRQFVGREIIITDNTNGENERLKRLHTQVSVSVKDKSLSLCCCWEHFHGPKSVYPILYKDNKTGTTAWLALFSPESSEKRCERKRGIMCVFASGFVYLSTCLPLRVVVCLFVSGNVWTAGTRSHYIKIFSYTVLNHFPFELNIFAPKWHHDCPSLGSTYRPSRVLAL